MRARDARAGRRPSRGDGRRRRAPVPRAHDRPPPRRDRDGGCRARAPRTTSSCRSPSRSCRAGRPRSPSWRTCSPRRPAPRADPGPTRRPAPVLEDEALLLLPVERRVPPSDTTSSACVPARLTRPATITKITSADTTVESRCAIAVVVRGGIVERLLHHALEIVSSALVASSSTGRPGPSAARVRSRCAASRRRTGGALRSPPRCRSPRERGAIVSWMFAARAAASSSASVASGFAYRRLSPIDAWKRYVSWLTMPMCEMSDSWRRSRTSSPANRTVPSDASYRRGTR